VLRDGQALELTAVRSLIRPRAADLQVSVKDGRLQIEASGTLPILDFEKGVPVPVVALSSNEFFVDRAELTRLAFLTDETGKTTRLVLNSGPWQITGQRIN
jgi:hypothetical protein